MDLSLQKSVYMYVWSCMVWHDLTHDAYSIWIIRIEHIWDVYPHTNTQSLLNNYKNAPLYALYGLDES